jgi:hypothetical protein
MKRGCVMCGGISKEPWHFMGHQLTSWSNADYKALLVALSSKKLKDKEKEKEKQKDDDSKKQKMDTSKWTPKQLAKMAEFHKKHCIDRLKTVAPVCFFLRMIT